MDNIDPWLQKTEKAVDSSSYAAVGWRAILLMTMVGIIGKMVWQKVLIPRGQLGFPKASCVSLATLVMFLAELLD